MAGVLSLLLSTVLSLAIPAVFVALWLAGLLWWRSLRAASAEHFWAARRPDLNPARRTSRLTDTTPRRLL